MPKLTRRHMRGLPRPLTPMERLRLSLCNFSGLAPAQIGGRWNDEQIWEFWQQKRDACIRSYRAAYGKGLPAAAVILDSMTAAAAERGPAAIVEFRKEEKP